MEENKKLETKEIKKIVKVNKVYNFFSSLYMAVSVIIMMTSSIGIEYPAWVVKVALAAMTVMVLCVPFAVKTDDEHKLKAWTMELVSLVLAYIFIAF